MKTVYTVYKTDNWHSFNSRDLIGVATSLIIAVNICKKAAKKAGEKLSADDLYGLNYRKQTQGYNEEGEFLIEEIKTNELI